MPRVERTFCRICEPMCPMLAEINDEGKVTALKPDREHPVGGTPCHKGLSWLTLHNDPDRLKWPLKRVNSKKAPKGEFERISWDQAFEEIGAKLKQIREDHGKNAVSFYQGNPSAQNSRAMNTLSTLPGLFETSSKFSPGTQDFYDRLYVIMAMYGSILILAPDLKKTDYLMVFGSNPKISHWTLVSVPNDGIQHLKDIKKRGGTIKFVNPRRIESSTPETGDTVRIKPDTDVYFLAALSHEIYKRGGFDWEKLDKYGSNVQGYLDFITRWTPEQVEDVTGIAADEIKTIAQEVIDANSAAFYISTGVHQGRQGILCSWMVEMLSFATGNLGKDGGNYKPTGLAEPMPVPVVINPDVDTPDGKLNVNGALPSVLFPEMVANGQVRAFLTFMGNPLMTMSGEQDVRKAMQELELMVCTDIYHTATAELADYVLPATDWMERADITALGIMAGQQITPHVQYTEALEEPAYERRTDWWIGSRLMQVMGMPSPLDEEDHNDGFKVLEQMLGKFDLDIEKIKASPQQTVLIEQEDKSKLYDEWLLHEDKRINCCPSQFEEGGLYERCDRLFEELSNEGDDILKLISMRTAYMHNSWMPNLEYLRKGSLSTNKLRMSPEDAAKRKLFEGDMVNVHNDNGAVVCQVEIRDDLREGVVAMAHGYGHVTPKMKVAGDKPGSNYNVLLPMGSKSYEPLSHMSWMCGVPVKIEKLINSDAVIASQMTG